MIGRPMSALLLCLGLVWASVGSARAAEIEVTLKGLEGAPRENVRALLSIADDLPEGSTRAPAVRRLHRRAPEEIRKALRPYGYYAPEIDSRLERTGEEWRARYRIDPGPRVQVTDVEITLRGDAEQDPTFDALRSELPLQAGEPLAHPDYSKSKTRLLELAAERGYFEAEWVTSRLEIDPEALSARAILVLDSGPRYAFGEVIFEQDELSERFLERYLPFDIGDPYQAQQVRELRFALDDSDYFERVDVRVQRERRGDGRVPIHVTAEARPQNRYTFGVGFGTDTGARVSAGWENRYINRQGHSLDTKIELAQIRTRLSARYRIPLAEPAREQMVFNTAFTEEEIGDGDTEEFTFGARRVETFGNFQSKVSLDFQRSADDIGGEEDTRDLVVPGASLTYSRFDDAVYATRGFRLGGFVDGGSASLGSDTSFLRARVEGQFVRQVWSGGRVLVRGELGTSEVDDVDELPLSRRFFAGGDNSVRGFDFQDLGPRDDEGDVVGGRHLVVGSVELEQMIHGNWGAAVFLDAGNAMDSLDVPLREAAGVGLRYRSPFGMFRVDVAKAIDGDESPRLHLSFGINL